LLCPEKWFFDLAEDYVTAAVYLHYSLMVYSPALSKAFLLYFPVVVFPDHSAAYYP
jgi:hypothetical protein